MPPGVVHRIMVAELGEQWREYFQSFDDTPAAAASIGQVHRAVWSDGRDVAVKLQYPGAAKALNADLRQIARLSRLFGVMVPGLDVKPLVKELQDRVVEELDYRLEAQANAIFFEAFIGDTQIVIPEPVHHTERLLVATWLESEHSLAHVITEGTQAERDHFGEIYGRFMFAGPQRAGLLHADPHPGNFRIMADGRIGVLDFGAVARLPDGLPVAMGQLIRLAVDRDYDAVRDGLVELGFLRPGSKLDAESVGRYFGPFVEPAEHDTFTFSREWMRGQMTRVSAPTSDGMGTALQFNLPPDYMLIHRVWMGGMGVLSQLGATAPFREILTESLPGFSE
jgi:predicted unusual protein kinase regulating ubiquinone biosynthesis (AarF/ABC1/UbiB family)